ncbi:alpha-amylase family glycosyl hydrolase [uncultured Winogradskyella sp.]|uniref:alpha-amylase family glycosyl hydrolase n=1 Tax=uncultured Winogradskyella sp. TaxID=395353 RepID=UPI002615DF8B|nr:alpha-amylase family glycosyl hydrolase [uncultured Winogradskyella sp.]
MKKLLLVFISFFGVLHAQQQNVIFEITPCSFQDNEPITIVFDGTSIDESAWQVNNNQLFLWAWSFDENDENIQDSPTNGQWTNSDAQNILTYNAGDDEYSITFTPTIFYNRPNIGSIGFLIKAVDGTGDKKSQDIVIEVGESSFTATRTMPATSTLVVASGSNLEIAASNTCGDANYVLRANGTIINSQSMVSSYSYTDTNITTTTSYQLEVTQGTDTEIISVSAVVNPGTVSQNIPAGLEEGINYDDADPTRATLVLDAPFKDYVLVAGSFNNWQPSSSYAMKKDPTSSMFWLELTNLTPNQIETYQYWVVDETPIANSPALVKTADPYSTLVLSPFDDPFIPADSYPNLPVYPIGQEREVTVLQTNQTEYPWVVTDFEKPKKEDLIIYEVLVRDFDGDRNYQDLIDRISYFKNLNVNAIQLMPVMEFEGNESWGYNTSFHMALDKFYGTEDKFKEFIDLCHQNGIAVILDVALNHAFGRNPFNRMWMDDPDGDGWGGPSSESPYFNQFPTHSFNVGNDFNHQQDRVKNYVKRVVKHWVEEFHIDGLRWDLTKGFTQNCGNGTFDGDFGCTQIYQQDRVDVLREYADYSWSLDETHYVIFEHLGESNEEKQWADYRLGDAIPKGIMTWGKMTEPYAQLSKGFGGAPANLTGVGHVSRNFNDKRLVGYAESHDEERVMYLTQAEGNQAVQNATLLESALLRASSVAATLIPVPGPKMIWHFGPLGMNNSIFTCSNGSTNFPNFDLDGQGDCKLDTKPQPQWTENWLGDANRLQVYEDYARLNALKINEPVFEANYSFSPISNNIIQRLYIWDDNLPSTTLKNVVVIANFSVADQNNINPDFPYTGTWYDLMDETGNTSINVTGTTNPIAVPAGQFRIFGNQPSQALSIEDETLAGFTIYPNPSRTTFSINENVSNVKIYSLTGKLVEAYNGSFTTSDTFDISALNSGIYLVKVENNKQQSMTTKLVKL